MIRIRGDQACFWAVMGAYWAEQQLHLPSGQDTRAQAGSSAERRSRERPTLGVCSAMMLTRYCWRL